LQRAAAHHHDQHDQEQERRDRREGRDREEDEIVGAPASITGRDSE
jgi:hypothetical protein